MNQKLKNIIIGVVVVIVLAGGGYFFLSKKPVSDNTLTVSFPGTNSDAGNLGAGEITNLSNEFINLLLSVKSIKLDDSIFSDPAFALLSDSTIILIPDKNEGRINPFAPIGSDAFVQGYGSSALQQGENTNTSVGSGQTGN